MSAKLRVLIGVLDWGLGHASRSIPLARKFEQQGATVVLAGAGRALALLRKECPHCLSLEMPAYGIRYFSHNMYLNMAWQGPRILRAIHAENQWLAAVVKKHRIDLVVSDNRYGCYHAEVPGIFLSHQLNIQLPYAPLHWLVNKMQQSWLKRFSEIWIPDYDVAAHQLAGALTQGHSLVPTRYIGWLSRLAPSMTPPPSDGPIVALLSGPEPQRSHWEGQVYRQLKALNEPALLVRGLPEQNERRQEGLLEVRSHLVGAELSAVLMQARLVICRPGYSSLMDMATIRQKVLLVPTPGQTEQIYLARYCAAQGWAPWQDQAGFELKSLMEALPRYSGMPGLPPGKNPLDSVIGHYL